MKQHTKPCAGCPFARATKPGELGGSPPTKYVGQIATHLHFLPCHNQPGYKPDGNCERMQCAGAGIFRANVGVKRDQLPSVLLLLEENTKLVFASYAEFVAHHMEADIELAETWLRMVTPNVLAMHEMQQVRPHMVKFKPIVPKGWDHV